MGSDVFSFIPIEYPKRTQFNRVGNLPNWQVAAPVAAGQRRLLSGCMHDGVHQALRFHDALPWRIRRYLVEQRGIRDDIIDRHLLGWNGQRITIPVFDRQSNFAFFRLAKDPEDTGDWPKMLCSPGSHAELYGWESVKAEPRQLVICEGEFDRLVLESHGFPAVTSTAGAGVFKPEWAEALTGIPEVFICFDRDHAGRDGVLKVSRLVPGAKIIELPAEVGDGGDVTDLFVRLKAGRAEFLKLMVEARPLPAETPNQTVRPPQKPAADNGERSDERIARIKAQVPIGDIIGQYVLLKRSGKALKGRCPFHEDHEPSLAVYPGTRTFHCFGCGRHGDVFAFLMEKEGLSFPEAVEALSRFIHA